MPMLDDDGSLDTTWQDYFSQGGTLIPPRNAPLRGAGGLVSGPWLLFFGT